MIETIKHVS